MDQNRQANNAMLDLSVQPYEPPRIERILTPEDLERELQYAGIAINNGGSFIVICPGDPRCPTPVETN